MVLSVSLLCHAGTLLSVPICACQPNSIRQLFSSSLKQRATHCSTSWYLAQIADGTSREDVSSSFNRETS